MNTIQPLEFVWYTLSCFGLAIVFTNLLEARNDRHEILQLTDASEDQRIYVRGAVRSLWGWFSVLCIFALLSGRSVYLPAPPGGRSFASWTIVWVATLFIFWILYVVYSERRDRWVITRRQVRSAPQGEALKT